MNKLFVLLGLDLSYKSDFDSLCCLLSGFPDGLKYLSGDDSAGHYAVSIKLVQLLSDGDIEQGYIVRLLYVFNALKHYFFKNGFFKADPMFSLSVLPEKNLLAELLSDDQPPRLDHLLDDVFTIDLDDKCLSDKQRIGLLSLLLAVECGVLVWRQQVELIAALASGNALHRIQGLYFIDYSTVDEKSQHSYVKRVILSPLTLSLILHDDFIGKLKLIMASNSVSSVYLSAARLQFLNVNRQRRLELRSDRCSSALIAPVTPFTGRQVRSALRLFSVLYLPGYLVQIANGRQLSFCVSLQNFAQLHGVHVDMPSHDAASDFSDEPETSDSVDAASSSNGGENDDSDGADVGDSKRQINTRYFAKHDFLQLLDYLSIHPSVSPSEFVEYKLILSMCFYMGFRRAEALYLRRNDIFPVEAVATPASLYVRPHAARRLKTATSRRHQPLTLLPQDMRLQVAEHADFSSADLLIGRVFDKSSAIHFFSQLSKLMQELLGKSFVIHTTRHSYVSNGILKSQFAALKLDELVSGSSFLREIAEDEKQFRASFRLPDVTMQHVTNLSQSAGHSTIGTTLKHYCHSTDLLMFGALNANRPEGYLSAVARYSGVTKRTLLRWKETADVNGVTKNNTMLESVMHKVAQNSAHIQVHTQKLVRIDEVMQQSFELYKQLGVKGKLSSRQLEEWVRLYRLFSLPGGKPLIVFIAERLSSRGAFRIADKRVSKSFLQLIKGVNGMSISDWELKQPATKSQQYQVLSNHGSYAYPIEVRVRYAKDNGLSSANAPRQILEVLIQALYDKINMP